MRKYTIRAILLTLGFFLASPALAASVEVMKDVPVDGGFPVGPTSFTLELLPGQSAKRSIQVDDRSGREKVYKVEVEDFVGSSDFSGGVELMGPQEGKYSAKSWFKPELTTFTLQHGEREHFDVNITVPLDADAGDHYAAVLVRKPTDATDSQQSTSDSTQSNVKIDSRVGVLFYVRVKGDVKQEGELSFFKTDKPWYEKAPVKFALAFKNLGSVHFRPTGTIEIFDMFGKSMESMDVKPAIVLRDSSRESDFVWNHDRLFGRYQAKLTTDLGTGQPKIERSIYFWVIPWKIVLAVLLGFIVLISLLVFIKKKFKFSLAVEKKGRRK